MYFRFLEKLGLDPSFNNVPCLVEIGTVVLEKIFKFCQRVFVISKLSPLGKGRDPLIKQNRIPFTQGRFVPSLVEIGPVVLEST